jgi:putative RNA 2'-phosphotransferase
MLRHRSDEFGLNMDPFGWVPVAEISAAVSGRYDDLGEKDVRNLVADPDQHRFEIVEDRIRALYGHSFFVKMDGDPTEPLERLYLWCSIEEARRYRDQGVKPHDRSYVHLSLSKESAEARSRRVDAPCVVEILARQAHDQGVVFHLRGEVVLTTAVPAEFVGEITGLDAEDGSGEAVPERKEDGDADAFGRRMRRATRSP